MKKSAILIILILLNSLIVLAELNDTELKDITSKINEKRQLIPPGLAKIFNELNAVVIIDGIEYTAISTNGELTQLSNGKPENPTMEILVSEESIRDILNSKITFGEALEKGKVIYRPISNKSKIVFGIAKFGNFINRLFRRR